MFRDDFVWGVASSAYQIEGREPDDGCGAMIWDKFIEEGGTKDGLGAQVTCDHMHRYKDDYKLMNLMSIKAYRFSINWSRLIPDGIGEVNQKAVALYRDMILEMKKNGVEPYLTMYHWELPQALQDKGGWLNDEIIQWFAYYAKVVAENFSDIVEYFITLNEPECFVGLGNLTGVHAPGLKLPHKDVFQITHNALKAHGQAVITLRKYACRPIKIGYAPTCGMAIPYTNKPEDIEAARKVLFGFYQSMDNWTWNVAWFNDPVFLGAYPESGLEKFKEYLPEITKEDMELISQPLDFMGQNIYNGYYVAAGEDGEPVFIDYVPGYTQTFAEWPVTPECIYWGLKFIYERYHAPIYVTENGMSCHDVVSVDGKVHDPNRQDFLDRYISAIQKVNDEGADIRGYFLWTFLDNFEWDKGYTERFGIVHVDFTTQKRIIKDSAFWYKKVIDTNGAILTINQKERPVIFLEPEFKENIWGSQKLKQEFGYDIPYEKTGECWAIAANDNGCSVVKEGPYKGKNLKELYLEYPELFGNIDSKAFPLLIKIISADDDLSIQVHPDNEYANANENGSFGKTECWYILDCKEDAQLVVGHNAKTKDELKSMISEGKWNQLISKVPVKKGDFIQIDPGTVHAITGGMMILETQQNSDITYRVYDYDRLQNGQPRQLHIRQSIDVITCPANNKDLIKNYSDINSNEMTKMISCDYYTVWKLKIDGSYILNQNKPFMNVSVIEGEGLVNGQLIKKGDHFILPNGIGDVELMGKMTLIVSSI